MVFNRYHTCFYILNSKLYWLFLSFWLPVCGLLCELLPGHSPSVGGVAKKTESMVSLRWSGLV